MRKVTRRMAAQNRSAAIRRTRPDAGEGRKDRHRNKAGGDGEVLAAELAEQKIGRDLDEVDRGEEHRRRPGEDPRLQMLGHHIDLEGRRPGVTDETRKAGERAPQQAGRNAGRRDRGQAEPVGGEANDGEAAFAERSGDGGDGVVEVKVQILPRWRCRKSAQAFW